MGSAGFEPATHRKRELRLLLCGLLDLQSVSAPSCQLDHEPTNKIEKKKKGLILEKYFTA